MIGSKVKDIERLVYDYVLGQASREEQVWTESLMGEDEYFRAEISGLRERLHELDYSAAPEPVRRDLWSRIEHNLNDKRLLTLDAHRRRPEPSAKREPAPQRATGAPTPADSGIRTGYWKGFFTSAIAASLLLAVAAGALLSIEKPPEPVAIAILVDSEANPGAIVEAMADNRVRVRPLVNINVPAGRTLEVWTLQNREDGPVSLGLLENVSDTTLTDFDLPRPNADQLYEITLEPAAGSPIGRPTGPILFKGLAKILR